MKDNTTTDPAERVIASASFTINEAGAILAALETVYDSQVLDGHETAFASIARKLDPRGITGLHEKFSKPPPHED